MVEAAAFGALTARFRHNVFPAPVLGRGQGLQYLQHVGQFRCQLPVRRRLRFMHLLQQLGPQGRLIAGLVQDPVLSFQNAAPTPVGDWRHASGFIYQSTDDTPDAEVLAGWAAEIIQPSATRSPNSGREVSRERRPVGTSPGR